MAKLMAILNVTPDSFSDGGDFLDPEKAIHQAFRFMDEGADIIDVGAESTRPFSDPVSQEEEKARLLPVLEGLKKANIPFSIDTKKPAIAKMALEKGATLLNDVSGFTQKEMQEIAASTGCQILVMHHIKDPKTMQENPNYPDGVIQAVQKFFSQKIEELIKMGVKEKNILLDPGIGFGKTVEDNFKILNNINQLKELGFPILIGLSRKSFLEKILHLPPKKLDGASLIMNTLALIAGVDWIRVHDVRSHKDAITLLNKAKSV